MESVDVNVRVNLSSTQLSQRFRVTHKIMDALYGPVLRCIDLQQQMQPTTTTSSSSLGSTIGNNSQKVVALKHVSLARAQLEMDRSPLSILDNPWKEKRVVEFLTSLGGHANILQYHQVLQVKKLQLHHHQHHHLHLHHHHLDHRCHYHHDRHLHHHPSIDTTSALVFVMEFCSRGDLLDHMNQYPDHRMPEEEALQMLHQVAQAVQFLHQNGIAHRDLSLENVLLTNERVPKVCDFALSCDTWQRCQGAVGKVLYMAPEVVSGSLYKPVPADVWSLGVMLFVLLTGSRLCEIADTSDVAFDVVRNHGACQLMKIWGLDAALKEETLDLIDGMLRVNPDERLSMNEIVTHAAFRDVQSIIRTHTP